MSLAIAAGSILLRTLLPDLIGKMGKKEGRIAEAVVDVIHEVTGLDEGSSEADLMDALEDNHELLAQVKMKAMDVAMAELAADVKYYEADTADRNSARRMQSHNRGYLSIMAFASFFASVALLVYLLNVDVPSTWVATIGGIVGYTGGWVNQVMNFEFGSSKGSKDKQMGILD